MRLEITDDMNMYPRPQMVRDSYLCLNGEWDFCEADSTPPEEWTEKINVPYAMEAELSGIKRKHKNKRYIWYRRKFFFEKKLEKGRVLLHCSGIEREASVWLNGIKIDAEMSFLKDTVELSNIRNGENEIIFRIYDDLTDYSIPYGKQSNKPAGMWYTPVSGIWQTVWIEEVPERYVKSIKIIPNGLGVIVKTTGVNVGEITLESGECFKLEKGYAVIRPKRIHSWSPEKPYLYHFTLKTLQDEVKSYFAIRTLKIKEIDGKNRLCMNGKPYFFHGLLDQGYWPDGIYTPNSPKCYEKDIDEAKKLGFNMLRKHIKVEPEIFYYLCDVKGMTVFQDMVNNGDYSFWRDTIFPTFGFQWLPDYNLHKNEYCRRMFVKYAHETIKRLYNHPSIVYWTIFNEGWGQFSSSRMYDKFKVLDPHRFVDSASGWFRCGRSDVDSRHVYFHRFFFPISNKPVVLSEFGGYAYKIKSHSYNARKQFGYAVFRNAKKFNRALYELFERDVISHIEDGLCASVYTQISDVETEENGLFTYDRNVCKVDFEIMEMIRAGIEEKMKLIQNY